MVSELETPTEEVLPPNALNLTVGPNYHPVATVSPSALHADRSLGNLVIYCRLVLFVGQPHLEHLPLLPVDLFLPLLAPLPPHGKPLHLENNSTHLRLEGIGIPHAQRLLTVVQ